MWTSSLKDLKKYIPFKGSLWTADDLVADIFSRTGPDDSGVGGGSSLIGPKEYTGAPFLGLYPSRSETRGVSIADNGGHTAISSNIA